MRPVEVIDRAPLDSLDAVDKPPDESLIYLVVVLDAALGSSGGRDRRVRRRLHPARGTLFVAEEAGKLPHHRGPVHARGLNRLGIKDRRLRRGGGFGSGHRGELIIRGGNKVVVARSAFELVSGRLRGRRLVDSDRFADWG